MLLDISRLRTGVEPIDRTYAPEAFGDLHEEFRVTGETTVRGAVRRDGQGAAASLGLTVRVQSVLEMPCSRCLEAFAVPVDAEVETRFVSPAEFARVTAETQHSGEMHDAEVQDRDLGLAEYHDETIDLGAVVREQFFLALPMKPLCQETCQGLCPVCGKNRNREACECRQEWVDPRLAALANLKKTT
jgi:uncharacterized protein